MYAPYDLTPSRGERLGLTGFQVLGLKLNSFVFLPDKLTQFLLFRKVEIVRL